MLRCAYPGMLRKALARRRCSVLVLPRFTALSQWPPALIGPRWPDSPSSSPYLRMSGTAMPARSGCRSRALPAARSPHRWRWRHAGHLGTDLCGWPAVLGSCTCIAVEIAADGASAARTSAGDVGAHALPSRPQACRCAPGALQSARDAQMVQMARECAGPDRGERRSFVTTLKLTSTDTARRSPSVTSGGRHRQARQRTRVPGAAVAPEHHWPKSHRVGGQAKPGSVHRARPVILRRRLVLGAGRVQQVVQLRSSKGEGGACIPPDCLQEASEHLFRRAFGEHLPSSTPSGTSVHPGPALLVREFKLF